MKLKVLYVTHDYSPHDERFLTALGSTGNQVHFFRTHPSHQIKSPQGVIEIPTSPQLNTRLQIYALRNVLKTFLPDVVHAGPLHGPAYIAARAGATPLVSMSWGFDLLNAINRSSQALKAARYSLAHSTVFTGDCQAVSEKAKKMGVSQERIFIFPWGVDLDHFSPAGIAPVRQKLGWDENFVILCNRSFEPIYGVDVLLKAFIRAVKVNPAIRLLLCGKGSQEAKFRSMVERAGFQDKVNFGGYASRDDLPGLYRSADVFVTASHCDGSSVSLMESLACGLPVLASDIASNLEWIKDGVNGWVFQDSNDGMLTTKILEIAKTGVLKIFKDQAVQTARRKANWKENFPVLLRAYERAMEIQKNSNPVKGG